MTWKQFLVTLGILVLILITLFLAIPGSSAVFNNLLKTTAAVLKVSWGVLLFIVIIGLPLVFGPLARARLFWWIDKTLSPDQDLNAFQTIILSLVFSLINGVVWISLVPILTRNNWLHKALVGLGWKGVYETAPLGWGIYAFCAFFVAFWISYLFKDF